MTRSALEEKRESRILHKNEEQGKKHMSNNYEKVGGKDRRDHRWRYRHRPRGRKALHRRGRPRLHLRPPAVSLDAALTDLGPNGCRDMPWCSAFITVLPFFVILMRNLQQRYLVIGTLTLIFSPAGSILGEKNL